MRSSAGTSERAWFSASTCSGRDLQELRIRQLGEEHVARQRQVGAIQLADPGPTPTIVSYSVFIASASAARYASRVG
jgi:hypothetical protein